MAGDQDRAAAGGPVRPARYTFGDGVRAARRLALLAEVLAPTSRSLLQATVDRRPRQGPRRASAVDVGCGPGHTTRLLARIFRPGSVVGIDAASRFVDLARKQTADNGLRYLVHDATVTPFPGAPYDLLYSRFLLAHLPDPLGLVERWRGQVHAGGVLVLEETEQIEAPPGVLADYEELVTTVVAAEGASLAAGQLLAPLGGQPVRVPVDAAAAARIYGLNLANWSGPAVADGLVDASEVDRVAAGLDELENRPGEQTVDWIIRQITLPA